MFTQQPIFSGRPVSLSYLNEILIWETFTIHTSIIADLNADLN